MNFLFDTSVISAQRRADRLPSHVSDWLAGVAATDVYISAITLQEIETGVLRMERTDPAQGARLRRWKDDMVSGALSGRILPVDETVAECCAALHVPDPRPALDALIGATAIVHRMTLVTRNVADFEAMPVKIFNPWTLAGQ